MLKILLLDETPKVENDKAKQALDKIVTNANTLE